MDTLEADGPLVPVTEASTSQAMVAPSGLHCLREPISLANRRARSALRLPEATRAPVNKSANILEVCLPRINRVAYQKDDGTVAQLEWFEVLPQKARAKCAVRLERLAELGH